MEHKALFENIQVTMSEVVTIPETEIIKLCVNIDCERYVPDWDDEEDTEETYQVGQWQKCCLCDGYFND